MLIQELLNLMVEETSSFPEPTPANVDHAFKVGRVNFDNKKGLGATPNSGNILYKGAVAWIKPTTFRALALSADRSEDAQKLAELMKREKPIAAPWLDIEVTQKEDGSIKDVRVTGHEGRARSDAFVMINGNIPMPVQLQLRYIRARDLSQEFFDWIEENGIKAEDSSRRVFPDATEYFWQGTVVKS